VRLCEELEIGPLKFDEDSVGEVADPVRGAQVYAQTWMAADHACTEYEAIVLRRYNLLRRLPRNLVSAPQAIFRGLQDLACTRGCFER
jgi:hypothetical protein